MALRGPSQQQKRRRTADARLKFKTALDAAKGMPPSSASIKTLLNESRYRVRLFGDFSLFLLEYHNLFETGLKRLIECSISDDIQSVRVQCGSGSCPFAGVELAAPI
jgi:hypothetical protein